MTQATTAPATTRAQIPERTLRKDPWWRQPAINGTALAVAVIYLTWASLVNADYFWEPYISPLYSPCLVTTCTPGAGFDWIPWLTWLSPAVLIIGGPRAARQVHRGDQVPADPAERAPVLLLDRDGLQRDPVHRRGDRVPQPRRAVGPHGPRHPGAGRERHAAVAVLAVLPRVPAHRGRPAQALLQAPGQVLDVDPGVQAEHHAHAVRLDIAVLGAADRSLHPAGGQRRHHRPAVLLGWQRVCRAHD